MDVIQQALSLMEAGTRMLTKEIDKGVALEKSIGFREENVGDVPGVKQEEEKG